MQFITGKNQQTYFSTFEEQVAADNAVRIIDAFVDKRGLQKMGFTNTVHKRLITKNQTIQMGKGTIISFAKNNRMAQPKTIFSTCRYPLNENVKLLCHL